MKITLLLLCYIVLSVNTHSEHINVNTKHTEYDVITNDGTKLYCFSAGESSANSAPVVVLHGGPGLTHQYLSEALAEPLSQSGKVIFYDQRGSGNSAVDKNQLTKEKLTIDVFVNDLEAVRKSVDAKKISILAHSWGGMLAMKYALKFPDNVEKMVLLNSLPACADGKEDVYQAKMRFIALSDKFHEGDADWTMAQYRDLFLKYFIKRKRDLEKRSIDMSLETIFNSVRIHRIFTDTTFSQVQDFHKPLGLLEHPVLIIHGSEDHLPESIAQRLKESFPIATYLCLGNSGHFPFIENDADLLIALANAFLRPK